ESPAMTAHGRWIIAKTAKPTLPQTEYSDETSNAKCNGNAKRREVICRGRRRLGPDGSYCNQLAERAKCSGSLLAVRGGVNPAVQGVAGPERGWWFSVHARFGPKQSRRRYGQATHYRGIPPDWLSNFGRTALARFRSVQFGGEGRRTYYRRRLPGFHLSGAT